MPINCSTQASTSNSPSDGNNSESRLNLCQSLLKRRLELAKADPNSKDPTIISTRKDVSAQLSSLICEPGGVEILFLAIDQTSDPSFWNTTIACYSLSTIILSVPQKNVFTVMTEIRKLIQNEAWGNKLSLLLASLIEISERIPTAKVASAADVVFVDFILRPFQRLWEGNWKFLMQTDTNGHWNQLLDSSIWTAHCWLKHSNKMKRLKVHSRLDKFFSVCMVMNGHLGALEEKQQTVLSGLKQAFVEIIAGIVGSNSDVNQEKNAEYFVKNFIEISESSLPFFDFSVASKQLIEVVDEKKISSAKKLIFKQANLNILPLNEATANLDAYINSLIEFAETLNSKDKARLLINLWSECVQNWTTYKQDMQWSTSESKWSSICGKSNTAAQNVEKRRFIVEYFMSALETLLDNIADDLDQTSTLKLVELSKNLISTSINELSDEFARVSGLDLNTGLDSIVQTRAKTLHLAIGLCGFVLFQGDELPKEMKKVFNELIQLLRALLELIDENKHLPIGELQLVADSAQQILSLSSQFLFDSDCNLPAQKPIVLNNKKNKSDEFTEYLRIVEADYSQEVDGSVEIAERGHAIISMEKKFRTKCQADLESIGMSRIFDALADNLRHPDSYVYLAAINALCELSSWHHKICLPKMMFLLKNWSVDDEEEDSKNEEDTDEISKQNEKWNRIRCQVQLGESIAKVVLSLGDLAPSYFNELSQFFLDNAQHEDQIISASALSGLANLILACRGRLFTKIINELIFCCETKLKPTCDSLVRRAAIHLLRSIVTSCQLGVFTDIKESSSQITSLLRRIRVYDPDSTVRLHADLALLEVETALNEIVTNSLDKNTRVIK